MKNGILMATDKYFEETCGKSFETMAYYWSPISFQFLELNDDNKTKMDLLCPINFPSSYKNKDSDEDVTWNTGLVRKRLAATTFEELVPTVYYSVAITETHYYILYAFYHADDETHPNDLEGCLVIIKRGEKPKLYGMVTVAHHDFIPYIIKGEKKPKLAPFWQNKFELVYEKEEHGANVVVKQTKGKHPLYSVGRNVGLIELIRRRKNEILGTPDDVIMYIAASETPTTYTKERLHQGKGSVYTPTITYQLVDILDPKNGFYTKLLDAQKNNGNDTFTKEGKFHKDPNSMGQANGPWLWAPDKIWFGKGFDGQIWHDPAKVALKLFNVDKKDFSTFYQKKMFE